MKKLLIVLAAVALVGCCIVALVVGVTVMSGDGDTSVARPPVYTGTVSPTPVPPAPPFEEIRTQHDAMTEAQWRDYRKRIEGTMVVSWRGWIDEVTGNPGRYRVMIDMDAPDDVLSYPEIGFIVPDDVALALQIDQAVTFSGQIDTAQDMLGALDITLKNASLQ